MSAHHQYHAYAAYTSHLPAFIDQVINDSLRAHWRHGGRGRRRGSILLQQVPILAAGQLGQRLHNKEECS